MSCFRRSIFAAFFCFTFVCGCFAQTFTSHVDLQYVNDGNVRHRLDVYTPDGASSPTPLIVWIHGGGWQTGGKGLAQNSYQFRYPQSGYALASINYRLSGEAIFPAQIHDAKSAIRWLRANAGTYNIDPTRIGVWGSSAGGHLVALLGTSNDVVGLEGTLGVTSQSSRVQAVVDWFGPTDFLQMDMQGQTQGCGQGTHNTPGSPESLLIGCAIQTCPASVQLANPLTYYSSDDPPFLIQHGGADCTVPTGQSQILNSLMQISSHDVTTNILAGAGHGGVPFSAESNMLLLDQFWSTKLRNTQNPLILSVKTFYKSREIQSIRPRSFGRLHRFEITGLNTAVVSKVLINGVERNVEIIGNDKVRIYGFPGIASASGEIALQLRTSNGRFSNVLRVPIEY